MNGDAQASPFMFVKAYSIYLFNGRLKIGNYLSFILLRHIFHR
jgi:hypothetical protein